MTKGKMLRDPLTTHVRELFNLSDDWQISCRSVQGQPPHYRIEGAEYHVYERGPKTSQTNWNRRITEPEIFFIGCDQHVQWCHKWAAKHGRCWDCLGRGSHWRKWTRQRGGENTRCATCGGTGQAS